MSPQHVALLIFCVVAPGVLAVVSPAPFSCGAPFSQSSYSGESFHATTPSSLFPMGVAWDGTNYWGVNDNTFGYNEGQYSPNGTLQDKFASSGFNPGVVSVDFTSVFVHKDGSGPVYASSNGSPDIYVQKQPGQWVVSFVLSQSIENSYGGVAYDSFAQQLTSLNFGAVSLYNNSGTYVGSLSLVGYGDAAEEFDYPQQDRMAWGSNGPCGYYLTYSAGLLSAWDTTTGVRVGNTTLLGAGTDTASYYSFSYANGYVFVYDADVGDVDSWKKYKVF